MAKLTPNGLSGSLGNLVHYTSNGKQIVKTKPTTVRQTEATKASASKFGIASGCARAIREGLIPFITPLNNLQMRNSLTSAVYEWVNSTTDANSNSFTSVSTLNGFDFNSNSPLRKILSTAIQVDWSASGRVTVLIPAIDPKKHIKAPGNTASIDIWIGVTNFTIDNTVVETSRTTILQIPYLEGSIAPKEIELNIDDLQNSLNVLAIGLRFNVVGHNTGVIPESNMKWLPAGIVDAVYKGNPVPAN